MDVIEDMTTVLQLVLDYLGIDMAEFVHVIETRFLRIVRMRRQKSRWSLVRYIGAVLPLRPARRIRLQSRLLGNRNHHHGSMESLVSTLSSEMSDDQDLVWIEEDLGDNVIHYRAENRACLEGQCLGEDLDDGTFVVHKKTMTSTPINLSLASCSTMSVDPATVMKLTAMEDELAELRRQIAQLVMSQEVVNKSVKVDSDCHQSMSPVVSAALPPPPPPTCVPPPPPPPPPPPTVPSGIQAMKMGGMSLADLIKKGKDHLSTSEKNSNPLPAYTGVPDMSQILKGLTNVKLKSVKRSPGGTPFRQKPAIENNDPASIIAQALKKKFAHRHLFSPDRNKENHDSSFSSPEHSPVRPFGQHILRKTNKRSSLVTDSTQIIACGGPLQERNC
ncbi:mitochondrial fission regulator 2-like [Gigantopelta aegis]|uniref:mitochondrial fission regulator 2-like n=1 Tax=Gigantopelta aegis TaxID=1735272 RepID=UPI001B88B187|nr:mitochondrial fission regulator 2-like [Gigantopelta aegis]XP_041358805.1 mitochondrial fission regulator 2-like [Gigantopelta aegis]